MNPNTSGFVHFSPVLPINQQTACMTTTTQDLLISQHVQNVGTTIWAEQQTSLTNSEKPMKK